MSGVSKTVLPVNCARKWGEIILAEGMLESLIPFGKRTAVFWIAGECQISIPVLDQCVRQIVNAHMIFHKQDICFDLRDISVGGRIDAEEEECPVS